VSVSSTSLRCRFGTAATEIGALVVFDRVKPGAAQRATKLGVTIRPATEVGVSVV